MRNIWTEGSSARKYDEWYRTSPNSGRHYTSNYHPTKYDRQQEHQASIEYVEPPEIYAAKHPVKTAINQGAYTATDAVVRTYHAIPIKILSEVNQGLILATNWINTAIGVITALVTFVAIVYTFVAPMSIETRAGLVWVCGFGVAAACTILILLYRYHHILNIRQDRAGGLRKRDKITNSLKKTIFMLGRTLLFLFGIFVPGIAKICLLIFT